MATSTLTDEFSICLLADATATRKIETLRQKMPPSPCRDDLPHMTLLKGIHATSTISDEELLAELAPILQSAVLSEKARVRRITNRLSPRYKLASLVTLAVPETIKICRRETIAGLQAAGYEIDFSERKMFLPHVTIRLGRPASGPTLLKATELFPKDHEIAFSGWLILRSLEGKIRPVHELKF